MLFRSGTRLHAVEELAAVQESLLVMFTVKVAPLLLMFSKVDWDNSSVASEVESSQLLKPISTKSITNKYSVFIKECFFIKNTGSKIMV